MADRAFLERLTRQLADEGKLIEAGWVAMRLHVIPLDAPAGQIDEMRLAYMAGAQHLYSSMMSMFDPGIEETPADLRRMELIHNELQAFAAELAQRVPVKGRA